MSEGCSTTENHNSSSVAMETTEQSELPMDCEVEAEDDSPEQEKDFRGDMEPSDPPGGSLVAHPTTEADCSQTSEIQDQKEVSEPDPGHEELNRNESITSSTSDSPSSADSVYESETHCKRHDMPDQDPEQVPEPVLHPKTLLDPESEQEPEPEQVPEPELDLEPEPELDLQAGQVPEPELVPESEQVPEPELDLQPELVPEPEQYPDPDPEPDLESGQVPEPELELEPEQYPEPEDNLEQGQYPEPELDPELDLYPDPEPEDIEFSNLPMDTEDVPQVHESLYDPPIPEESVLEHCIREEAMSDLSNDSCHDLDPEDMDECLRVEIAAASSDSETDEKWRAIFSSSINKEDDDSYLDSLQLSAQELFVQKVDAADFEEEDNNVKEVCFDVPQTEEVLEQPEEVMPLPTPTQEVKYNPLGLQGLSKISEDESENGRETNHSQTSDQHLVNAEQNKKLPKDFCVIQETKSENVSTEHVDFQLARKQWREMEEQTKNKIIIPTTKQPSFHGSHSFMYTPVRNIERASKKGHDLEHLNLVGEYPHTQFSPCSEDSGLDDSSYRSPYDDPETPVEREIRISMEREENFRRERNLSRMGKSTDCAPSRGIPRSISTPLTPSFIITSSPTKEPLKHEVSANNVIILDPGSDFASNPRQGSDGVDGQSAEWRSEDNGSNLIILETSNLIIRSASEFSLNKACEQPQEKMFLNNPFFKLRSRSTMSLVDEEIKMVKQREEELRKERANLYGQDRFDADRMLSNHMDTLAFDSSGTSTTH